MFHRYAWNSGKWFCFASNQNITTFPGAAVRVRFVLLKSGQSLAGDVVYRSVTHLGLVHDVTQLGLVPGVTQLGLVPDVTQLGLVRDVIDPDYQT